MNAATPFAEGKAAHAAGKPASSNPQKYGSILWFRWMNGYQEGISVARKAADKATRDAVENRPLPEWAQEATS